MNFVKKYNVAGPRYTSYPTVPYWEHSPSLEKWEMAVKKSFDKTNDQSGISIYIHLPYCESLCTYCGCNTRITVNHAVERTYIISLLKEWKLYLNMFKERPHIREIHIGGGTPTFFSPEHLTELIEGIISSGAVCENAEFSFEAHPNNTTEQHLQTLYNLGFRRLSLGIQDFDLQVQKIVNRIQPFKNVEKVTRLARAIGFTSVNFDLIYGLPRQKKQSVINTVEKINLLRPDRIAFYSYAHVPWVKPGQRKFTEKDLPKDEEKRELYETGRMLLEQAGYIEIGMDHFTLPTDSLYSALMNKTLHRNFMGYTPIYTRLMIGLGASSISDAWHAYAQNVKTIEEYHQLINEGILPVFRGHLLDEEDLIIRKHILNIMCRFETSWENEAAQTQVIYDAVKKLKEMQNDGLLILDPFHLKVTEQGRPFIRNICMAFDARLWRNTPSSQIFSHII